MQPLQRRNVATAIATAMLITSAALADPANVSDFGAKGDGRTNDSEAFTKAFAAGHLDVYVPPGQYLIGPKPIHLPKNAYLHGAGRASVIKVAEGTEQLLMLDAGVRLERLHFDGRGAVQGDISDELIKLGPANWPDEKPDHITIDSLSFADTDRTCLRTDHNNYVMIRNCEFIRVGAAICLDFSRNIQVYHNTIVDARVHGIQFWGNSNWQRQESSDLIFAHNYVKNGGSGPIWGTGASRVIMIGNIVDGANDIGLDLEWCADSVIANNTVRNCQEAGIALFYACKRVTITGNTVINNEEITEGEAKKSWFVRSGIWLTYPNRDVFKNDFGHEDITISGNTIHCAEGNRRAIWIGSQASNVHLSANTISGGPIRYGGEHNIHPMDLETLTAPIIINGPKAAEKADP